MSEESVKKTNKVNDLLGVALKSAISRTLGASPIGIGAGVAVDVVKAATGKNKVTQVAAANSAAEEIKDTIVKEIAKDPVLINQMNLESPFASRTAQGGFTATVLSAILLYKFGWQIPFDNWDLTVLVPAFGTFTGGLWVLWGRLAGNLAPVFSKFTTKKVA